MVLLLLMLEGGNTLTMSKWHGGKGSGRRTTANNSAYDDGWEKIFGKEKPVIKGRKQTPSHGLTQVHKNKKKPTRVDLKKELRDNIPHGND